MKKTLIFILISLIALSTSVSAAYGDYELSDITFGEPYNYGTALTDITLSKGTTTYQDGKPVGITAVQGKPSKLQIIDVSTGKLIDAIDIPECTSMPWQIVTAPDGTVWFGGYTKARLYKYDPATKEITDYGTVGTTAVVGICFDDEGNVWISGNPSTSLYKFDIKTETITEVFTKRASNTVGLSITHHNGKIYYVVNNTAGVELFEYDIKTGTEVSYPKPDSVTLLWYPRAKNDKIMIYAELPNDDTGVIAFDTKTKQFTDLIADGEAGSRHFTPVIDGKVYFVKDHYAHGYDLATGELTKTDMYCGSILRGSDEHFVEIPNDPDFPGKSYVNFQFNGGMSVWNFETGVIKHYKDMMEGAPSTLMVNKIGANNKFYVTGFLGSKAVEIDLKTGEKKEFPISQATSVASYGDNTYFGSYPGGEIYKLDTTKTYNDKNPIILSTKLGDNDQQRIHNVINTGDKIVWSSFPKYNLLGGALAVLDPKTEEMDVYRTSYSFIGPDGTEKYKSDIFADKIVNQSILGLAYKDGKIYGGTSISGGLGIDATEKTAKIFVFNLETRTLEKCIDMNFIPGHENNVKLISGLTIAPDGNLIGITYDIIFKLDIDTLELIDYEVIIPNYKYSETGQQLWYTTYLSYDEETGFYFTFTQGDTGKIIIFDPYTLDYVITGDMESKYPELGSDGNLYYANRASEAIKLPVIRGNNRSYVFDNRAVLKVGKSTALIDGEIAAIDENSLVKPFFCKNNVMVPLRFISELFGYEIKWNQHEQYALLYKGEDSIRITMGSRIIDTNYGSVKSPVEPRIKDGRTFVHIRTMSDIIGRELYWNGDTNTIVIDQASGEINERELEEIFTYAEDYLYN